MTDSCKQWIVFLCEIAPSLRLGSIFMNFVSSFIVQEFLPQSRQCTYSFKPKEHKSECRAKANYEAVLVSLSALSFHKNA